MIIMTYDHDQCCEQKKKKWPVVVKEAVIISDIII
jgi:hypothetical protein